MNRVLLFIKTMLADFAPASVGVIDVVQIIMIAVFVYYAMVWIKTTKAYSLLKGLTVVFFIMVVAYVTQMNTIIWIFKYLSSVVLLAIVIIFQPELRKALDQLGERNMFSFFSVLERDRDKGLFLTDESIEELVHASFDMGAVKTGALMVLEKDIRLTDQESSGIPVDAVISQQLLINIFEHNTPLHDGAVIIRNNRIVAATCYLTLSQSGGVHKSLGTRHRAALGTSEESDSLTIIVSEETGNVSYAYKGKLYTNVNRTELKERLKQFQAENVVRKQ